MQIEFSSLTVSPEGHHENLTAARMERVLAEHRARVLGATISTVDVIASVMANDPYGANAAVVATVAGIDASGLPFAGSVKREFASDPAALTAQAARLTAGVQRQLGCEPVQLPDPLPQEVALVVALSAGRYTPYLKVSGALCEPGSRPTQPYPWAMALCRNLAVLIDRNQGYLLGPDGIEEYLDTIDDRALAEAVAAGARMDSLGRITGYSPDWERR